MQTLSNFMTPIIEVTNLSKKYNLSRYGGRYVAFRDVLTNAFTHPFNFLREKFKGGFTQGGKQDFWALNGVSFSVDRGEVLGIIGKNGAGKSTLLKILSRITLPTTGEIKLRGRVGSLLEVGTGFHPELTGRENVFLNGVILGMKQAEVEEKFDQIVEFAGIGQFLDTPVKRYSSGMQVRLAFAVAAHLEPEILLVDEVLAVGDAEFQKKCLGKMEEVTSKQGRTILFVSHNMKAIEQLCTKCLLLNKGGVEKYGPVREVINYYLDQLSTESRASYQALKEDNLAPEEAELVSAKLTDSSGTLTEEFGSAEDIFVTVEYQVKKELPFFSADFYLMNERSEEIFMTSDYDQQGGITRNKAPGRYVAKSKIPKKLLNGGRYSITLGGRSPNVKQYFAAREALSFQVLPSGPPASLEAPRSGIICPEIFWETVKAN